MTVAAPIMILAFMGSTAAKYDWAVPPPWISWALVALWVVVIVGVPLVAMLAYQDISALWKRIRQ